jgi:hypothetical protein
MTNNRYDLRGPKVDWDSFYFNAGQYNLRKHDSEYNDKCPSVPAFSLANEGHVAGLANAKCESGDEAIRCKLNLNGVWAAAVNHTTLDINLLADNVTMNLFGYILGHHHHGQKTFHAVMRSTHSESLVSCTYAVRKSDSPMPLVSATVMYTDFHEQKLSLFENDNVLETVVQFMNSNSIAHVHAGAILNKICRQEHFEESDTDEPKRSQV